LARKTPSLTPSRLGSWLTAWNNHLRRPIRRLLPKQVRVAEDQSRAVVDSNALAAQGVVAATVEMGVRAKRQTKGR